MGGEVFNAAGLGGSNPSVRSGWRLQVAVEVVEGEELHVNGVALLSPARAARRERDGDRHHGRATCPASIHARMILPASGVRLMDTQFRTRNLVTVFQSIFY